MTREETATTDITHRLGRIVLPLSVSAALLLAMSAPVAWFALRHQELDLRARTIASQLAADVDRFTRDAPSLWPYNAPKISQRLEGSLAMEPGIYVDVVGPRGTSTFRRDPDLAPYLWHTAPIGAPDHPAGWLLVGLSTREFLHSALLLLGGFGLLGALVAGFLYFLPLRTMRRTESRLAETLSRLEDAQEKLRDANVELESRVAEKTRGLVEAHNQLKDHETALRRLAASLYSAQEEERQRIASDLHDSVGQMLTAIRLNLETAARLQEEGKGTDKPALDLLQRTADLVNQTTESIRQAIYRLGSPALREGGLRRALELIEMQFEHTSCDLVVDVDRLPEGRLPAAVQELALRFVQEGITNALRHGKADLIRIRAATDGQHLVLMVEDNGDGGAEFRAGRGLAALRDRIALVGGEVRVETLPQGTLLAGSIPMDAGTEDGGTEGAGPGGTEGAGDE
jgi:signal transduction histidine kinase